MRQSIDLFLGLFSSFDRSLNWEVDDPPKFVHICNYFMTYKRFVIDMFCVPFPQNYCRMFPENQFCEVSFALKTSGYLYLTRNFMAFTSHEYEEILFYEDLLLAPSPANFQQFVINRLTELEQN